MPKATEENTRRKFLIGGVLTTALTAALPLNARAQRAEVHDLWAKLGECAKQKTRIKQLEREAEAKLPAWVLPGPKHINAKGERCGEISRAVEMENFALPATPDGFMRIRTYEHELRHDYKTQVEIFGSREVIIKGYRRRLHALRSRQQEALRLRVECGLIAAEDEYEVWTQKSGPIGDAIMAIEDTDPDTLTAQAMLCFAYRNAFSDQTIDHDEVEGYRTADVLILERVSPNATGEIGEQARALLSGAKFRSLTAWAA